MTNKNETLEIINSETFNKESLNLSFFKRDVIDNVLSLKIIEGKDTSLDTLNKYRYFDNYYILKVDKDFFLINSSYVDIYYNEFKPLKINDYHIYQRKDKLKEILNKTKNKE